MDNLDTLFAKKQYELIVKLTELSTDPKELFLRISSLIALSKSDEALDDIEKYQADIEKVYPYQLMKLHLELLLMKSLFDEARLALSHYENLPYVSQETEEFLREIKTRIEEESHPKNSKNFSLDEIYEILEKDTNQGNVSNVLFSLKNYNVNTYIDSLKIMLKRKDVHPNLRTYGLILLVDNKYDEQIEVLINDKIERINPSKINPPFLSKSFDETCQKITQKGKQNITLIETALHLFNCYIIDTYPLDIYQIGSDKLSDAFVCIAKTYLKIDEEVSEDTKKMANEIRSIIESTPDIKL